MSTNPYAPPRAPVADPESAYGLKRRSVWLVVLFTIVTFGFYYLLWFVRRRPGLNRLDSPRKLAAWPLVLFAIDLLMSVVIGFVNGATGNRSIPSAVGVIAQLYQLAVGVLMIVQCFRIKDIIEDHASPETSELFAEHVRLSGLMTFFFSIFYLQWAINKYVLTSRQPT